MTSSNEEKSSLEKLWMVWEVMEFPRGRLENTSTIFCGKFTRKQWLLKRYVKEMGGHVEEGFGPCLLVADLYSIKAPTEKFYRKVYECIQFGNPVYIFQEYEWLQFIGSKGTELPEAHEATVYLKTNFGIEDIKYRNWVKMNLLKREKTQTARELMYDILLFNTLPYICRLYGRYPKILAHPLYFDLWMRTRNFAKRTPPYWHESRSSGRFVNTAETNETLTIPTRTTISEP